MSRPSVYVGNRAIKIMCVRILWKQKGERKRERERERGGSKFGRRRLEMMTFSVHVGLLQSKNVVALMNGECSRERERVMQALARVPNNFNGLIYFEDPRLI